VRVLCGELREPPPADLDFELLPVRAATNHGFNDGFATVLARHAARHRPLAVVGFVPQAGLDFYYAADPCYAARIGSRSWRRYLPRGRARLRQEAAVFARGGATRILLPAPDQAQAFQRCYGTEHRRLYRLPPALDSARLAGGDGPALRARLGIPGDAPLLLTVARHPHTKGVDRVLRCLPRLPGYHYLVVGAGEPAGLLRMARRLGVSPRFHPLPPMDELAGAYAAANVLAHPARRENSGNTLLEAMACAVPVVASAECGFATHVRAAGCGEVLARGFATADLAEALRRVCAAGPAAGGPDYCARLVTGEGDDFAQRAVDVLFGERAA
jgi:UDP-glucose:(heptosyl)LPS alpha-1,3-glucosyltransferase